MLFPHLFFIFRRKISCLLPIEMPHKKESFKVLVPIISGIVDSVLVEAQLLGSEAVSLGFLQFLLHLGSVFCLYICDTADLSGNLYRHLILFLIAT
jgi:hypothetical protein